MCFRNAALVLLAVIAVFEGGRFRIAKVYIKEASRPRTTFRVFAPGLDQDVIARKVFDLAAGEDFMCHLYDWYGFRELDGGFGVATR